MHRIQCIEYKAYTIMYRIQCIEYKALIVHVVLTQLLSLSNTTKLILAWFMHCIPCNTGCCSPPPSPTPAATAASAAPAAPDAPAAQKTSLHKSRLFKRQVFTSLIYLKDKSSQKDKSWQV